MDRRIMIACPEHCRRAEQGLKKDKGIFPFDLDFGVSSVERSGLDFINLQSLFDILQSKNDTNKTIVFPSFLNAKNTWQP